MRSDFYNARRQNFQQKCRFCKWSKAAGAWISECTNKNSEYCGGECVEKQGYDSQPCDDKEAS